MAGRVPLLCCTALLLGAGCLGSQDETIPLLLDAYSQDTDDDGRPEVVLDLMFSDGERTGLRTGATGTLHVMRSTSTPGAFVEYATIPIDIRPDSLRWQETPHGLIYRHILNDHHFDSGQAYRFSLELTDDRGANYQAQQDVPYQ